MPEKKIIWSAEKYQKLLAATLAAHSDFRPNYTAIAGMFGEGATYDSIETRYRQVKKQAKALQAEIANGERDGTAPVTPRKKRAAEAAANGMTPIRKRSKVATPKKKPAVKRERDSSSPEPKPSDYDSPAPSIPSLYDDSD